MFQLTIFQRKNMISNIQLDTNMYCMSRTEKFTVLRYPCSFLSESLPVRKQERALWTPIILLDVSFTCGICCLWWFIGQDRICREWRDRDMQVDKIVSASCLVLTPWAEGAIPMLHCSMFMTYSIWLARRPWCKYSELCMISQPPPIQSPSHTPTHRPSHHTLQHCFRI